MSGGERSPSQTRVVGAAVVVVVALGLAWFSEGQWRGVHRVARDVAESAGVARTLGALAGAGLVAIVGLAVLRAPRWAFAAVGSVTIVATYLITEKWGFGPAAIGAGASFAQRTEALTDATLRAGSIAAAGLLTASASMAAGAVAVGLEPRPESGQGAAPPSGPRIALPSWALPSAIALLSIPVIVVVKRWNAGTDVHAALGAILPASVALAGVALAERGVAGARPPVLAASAIGLGAVVAYALALGATAAHDLSNTDVLPVWKYPHVVGTAIRRTLLAAMFALPLALTTALAFLQRSATAPALRRATFAALLVVAAAFVLLPLRARNALAELSDLSARQTALIGHPGECVEDPALPAGTLMVELEAANPALELLESAHVAGSPGERRVRWTPGVPAALTGVQAQTLELRVEGPYLAAPARVTMPRSGSGARVALLALPHEPPLGHAELRSGEIMPARVFSIDLVDPARPMMRWMNGPVIVVEKRLPRTGAGANPSPELLAAIADEHKMMGNHRDPNDRKLDTATVVAPLGAPFAEVHAIVSAMHATTREYRAFSRFDEIASRNVSVFKFSVVQPSPPRKLTADEAATRMAALAAAAPPADRPARLAEALGSCRALTCTPALWARLWIASGTALADEGAEDRAAPAFAAALAIDADAKLDDGASEAAQRALAAAKKRPGIGVVFGPHVLSGRVDNKEAALATLREAESVARLCFTLMPPEPPAAGAEAPGVKLRLVVGRDGVVHHEKRSDHDPDGLEGCVGRALERLTLRPPEGGYTTVAYRAGVTAKR